MIPDTKNGLPHDGLRLSDAKGPRSPRRTSSSTSSLAASQRAVQQEHRRSPPHGGRSDPDDVPRAEVARRLPLRRRVRPSVDAGGFISRRQFPTGPTISTPWPGKSFAAVSIISARKARSWSRRRQPMIPTRTKPIGYGRSSSRASEPDIIARRPKGPPLTTGLMIGRGSLPIVADIVAKVENRTTQKISRKSTFWLLRGCVALWLHYGDP
ncbi:hypothetical protein ABIB83_004675 [Bradyrhizobium sp. I1.8.5]